jgi:hypothetical protein
LNYPQEGSKQHINISFKNISEIVLNQLQELDSYGNRQQDNTMMTAMDFMNDFATEEFLTKNIRVRPQSGVTQKDGGTGPGQDGDNKSEANGGNKSNIFSAGGEGDDDEKHTKMMALEITDQRKNIKT